MKRTPWPRDDGRRLPKGQRRVRLWFVGHGKPFKVVAVRLTQGAAEEFVREFGLGARIRRAYAAVRWVEP